jgi:hypothetical protein
VDKYMAPAETYTQVGNSASESKVEVEAGE